MDSTIKPFWLEFIELYRLNSCLWDVTGKDYNNKMKRNESYKVLLSKLQEAIPSATIDSLKKKINNIRTSFRREFKKVLDSKASGSDPVYEPTLWYYNLLSFIGQTEAQRKEKSDDEDDYVTDLVDPKDISFLDIHVKEEDSMLGPNSPDDVAETLSETHEDDMSHNIYDADSSVLPNAFISRKRKMFSDNVNLFKQRKLAVNNLVRKTNEDEFSVTGRKIAFQLKRMDDRQRLIAEKLISDVMFYGGMGRLSEDAVVELPTRHLNDNSPI